MGDDTPTTPESAGSIPVRHPVEPWRVQVVRLHENELPRAAVAASFPSRESGSLRVTKGYRIPRKKPTTTESEPPLNADTAWLARDVRALLSRLESMEQPPVKQSGNRPEAAFTWLGHHGHTFPSRQTAHPARCGSRAPAEEDEWMSRAERMIDRKSVV